MEYREFAKFYDKLYYKKDYINETLFIRHFLCKSDNIIDMGCGTGRHMSLLEQLGYKVVGLDISIKMLRIAKKRVEGKLIVGNIKKLNIKEKYDKIICMFSVINLIKSTENLEKVLANFKKILREDGEILLDLRNNKNSGKSYDKIEDVTRIMEWTYDEKKKIEKTKIDFIIDGKRYSTGHRFRIYTMEEIADCCDKVGLKIFKVYEDYNLSKYATNNSKNFQFLIVHNPLYNSEREKICMH